MPPPTLSSEQALEVIENMGHLPINCLSKEHSLLLEGAWRAIRKTVKNESDYLGWLQELIDVQPKRMREIVVEGIRRHIKELSFKNEK